MREVFLKKRKKDDNYYSELQDTTRKRLEELSGKVWTDFNIHDPGITISDYLNYALYDLHYRFRFPLENYLFDSTHENNYAEKGLFPRTDLFTTTENSKEHARKSIVTEEDYEELLLKKHSDQLSRLSIRFNKQTRHYDMFILPNEQFAAAGRQPELEDTIKATYHQYRNLGENIGMIYYDWKQLEKRELYEQRKYTKKPTYEFPLFDDPSPEQGYPVKPFVPDYHSIQYDFPENYGIGERGIPHPEDKDYQLKVLQLKAYLLIFDHLMADQLQQAQNTATLFELSEQLPEERIPDVHIVEGEHIIDLSKKALVTKQEKQDQFYRSQKFRYLNLLDMLYGENTRTLFGKKDLAALNQKRAKLLQSLPKLNEFRFRSFNINEPHSIPVVQQILEEVEKEHFQSHHLYNKHIRVITDDLFFNRYRFLLGTSLDQLREQRGIENLPLSEEPVHYHEETSFELLHFHINLVWYGVIPESFLKYGTDPANYKIAATSEEYLLLFFHPEREVIINMSLFSSDKEKLIEAAHLFIALLTRMKVNGYQQAFYFVEHLLLDPEGENKNLVSIIIPEQLQRKELEQLIRERLPAHLQLTLYYVSPEALENFHTVYFNWRKALAGQGDRNLSYYAGALNFFLQYIEKSAKHI